jgi:hypothetical protein
VYQSIADSPLWQQAVSAAENFACLVNELDAEESSAEWKAVQRAHSAAFDVLAAVTDLHTAYSIAAASAPPERAHMYRLRRY